MSIEISNSNFTISHSSNVNVATQKIENILSNDDERQAIINKLDALISKLNSGDENIEKAKRKFESVKDEVQDAKEPDKDSIKKWLTGAKSILDSVKVAESIYTHAKDVYEAFGI